MKIVRLLEKLGSLIKGITETIKNEATEQKDGFFSILSGTLTDSLLGNALTGQGVVIAGEVTIQTF